MNSWPDRIAHQFSSKVKAIFDKNPANMGFLSTVLRKEENKKFSQQIYP